MTNAFRKLAAGFGMALACAGPLWFFFLGDLIILENDAGQLTDVFGRPFASAPAWARAWLFERDAWLGLGWEALDFGLMWVAMGVGAFIVHKALGPDPMDRVASITDPGSGV